MEKYKTVFVALDGSEHSERALTNAIDFAERFGSTLVLAHILDMQYFTTAWLEGPELQKGDLDPETGEPKSDLLSLGDYQRRQSRKIIQNAKSRVPEGVPYRVAFEVGSPRKDLLKMTKTFNADIVFIGSHGKGTLTEMVMGSVSAYLVEHAPMPVMVVK